MANIVRDLPALVSQTTGTGAVTQGIGSLDDASSITIFMQTTGGFNSSAGNGLILQVSQFDPAIGVPSGVTQSTGWNTFSTSVFTSSGVSITISNPSFRGLRIANTSSAATAEVVARVSKQISV